MSAVSISGIEGVSARYAAQIRELLYAQAVKRMAADEEAARADAEAERSARLEAIAKPREVEEPVKVDIEPAKLANPVKQPEAKDTAPAAPAVVPPAQIFDVQA